MSKKKRRDVFLCNGIFRGNIYMIPCYFIQKMRRRKEYEIKKARIIHVVSLILAWSELKYPQTRPVWK